MTGVLENEHPDQDLILIRAFTISVAISSLLALLRFQGQSMLSGKAAVAAHEIFPYPEALL